MKKVIAVLMCAVCLLAVGCSSSEEETITVIEPVTPAPVVTPVPVEATPTPEPVYTFPKADNMAEAAAKNSDVVGWITVPGTVIDFPILYGENWYYQNRNLEKEKDDWGSVYSHFNMATYEHYNTDQNLVVTAHNNRVSYVKGEKALGRFHELHHVQAVNMGKSVCGYNENDRECTVALDKATLPDFSTVEGRTWDISICGIDAQWEVWAMYEVEEDEPAGTLYYNTWFPAGDYKFVPEGGSDVQEWIDKQLSRSEYKFNTTVTTSDQFLTLYTCGDNHDSSDAQSRLYIFLKQVNPVSTKFNDGVRVAAEAAPEAEPAA